MDDFENLVGNEDGIDIEKEPVNESELGGRSGEGDSARDSRYEDEDEGEGEEEIY